MTLPIVVAIAGATIFSGAVLLWPLSIKPALRRRYERQHHRNKALRGRQRAASRG